MYKANISHNPGLTREVLAQYSTLPIMYPDISIVISYYQKTCGIGSFTMSIKQIITSTLRPRCLHISPISPDLHIKKHSYSKNHMRKQHMLEILLKLKHWKYCQNDWSYINVKIVPWNLSTIEQIRSSKKVAACYEMGTNGGCNMPNQSPLLSGELCPATSVYWFRANARAHIKEQFTLSKTLSDGKIYGG